MSKEKIDALLQDAAQNVQDARLLLDRLAEPLTPKTPVTEPKPGLAFAGSYEPDLHTGGGLDTVLKRNNEYAISDNVHAHRGVLNHTFVASAKGSLREGGAAFIQGGYLEYRIKQAVMFGKGFNPVMGGKFGFGLYGGTEGPKATGNTINPARWSLRDMWRPDEQGSDDHLNWVLYSYAADRDLANGKTWGDDHVVARICSGKWYQMEKVVGINTLSSRSDGYLEGWLDGERLLRVDNIRWQAQGVTGTGMLLSYEGFFGGNDSRWSPKRRETMQIQKALCQWRSKR